MKKTANIAKRAGCLLLAAAMCLGLTACSNEAEAEVDAEAKNYVFREEAFALDTDIDMSNVSDITAIGDRLYMIGADYMTGGFFLLSCNKDGSDVQNVSLELPNSESGGGGAVIMPRTAVAETAAAEDEETAEDETLGDDTAVPAEPESDPSAISYSSWVNQLTTDGTNLYMLVNTSYSDYTDPENPIWSETYSLRAFDTAGNELWSADLGGNDPQSQTTDGGAMSYFYVMDVVGVPQGGALVSVQDDEGIKYRTYGADGAAAGEFTLDAEDGGSFYTNGEGRIFMSVWEYTDTSSIQTIRELDVQNQTLSEPITVPGMESYQLSLCPYVFGGSYDLYLTDSLAVYGYNIGDADKTKLLDFIGSDIDSSNMGYLVILDDTVMLTSNWNYDYGTTYMSVLNKVDPADVKDKITLTLGCYGSYSIRSNVITFNKTNDQYRIQITDYSTYDTSDDWTAGLTRLNNDIVSGNVPDILVLDNNMPISSYISKGLFTDLYKFIDEDPDMSREDFLPNLLEAFSVDGALYQMVPSFVVYSMAAKTKYVGSEPGWTMADLMNLQSTLPEGMEILGEMTRDAFLSSMLYSAGSQFVDWKTGECTFDSQEFINLLEFANTLPEEIDPSIYEDEDYWMDYELMYREDRTLLYPLYMNNFRTYNIAKVVNFGEDITLIGYPTGEGNGAFISASTSMAISAQSKNPDGAWAFVRQYLLPDYQSTITYEWPARMDQLNVLMEEAQQRPYYMDENGEKVEYDDTYYIGDQQIVVPPISEADVNLVKDYITSITQVISYDEQLINIVTEEAAAYFAGQRSAAEAADIIQSRASIYISENR